MYRASFPETFRETNNPPKQGMKVFLGISVSIVIAYLVAEFMRRTGRRGYNKSGCGHY